MPKAFLFTHKRYELFNLNVPYSTIDPSIVQIQNEKSRNSSDLVTNSRIESNFGKNFVSSNRKDVELEGTTTTTATTTSNSESEVIYTTRKTRILLGQCPNDESKIAEKEKEKEKVEPTNNTFSSTTTTSNENEANDINQVQNQNKFNPQLNYGEDCIRAELQSNLNVQQEQQQTNTNGRNNCEKEKQDQHFLSSERPINTSTNTSTSTTSIPSTIFYDDDLEQPVNLSLKKSDLFNLTQLAEVSLAAAKCESESFPSISRTLSSISVTSPSSSSSCSSGSEASEVPSRTLQLQCNNHTHVCSQCGKGFSTLSNLARHRQTHRNPNDSSAVKKCPHCDKMYVSMPAFSMHLRTHNQGCKCPFCGKGFSRPWLLQGHIRTHTGEKPFSCSICSKSFADKSNLRAHCQTHSNEKPFFCSRCNKSFALKSYLMKHIESSCMRTSGNNNKMSKNFINLNLNSPNSNSSKRGGSCGENSPKSDSS